MTRKLATVELEVYSQSIGRRDMFDQQVAASCVLRCVKNCWRTLFYDLVDISVVILYVVCREGCATNPESMLALSFDHYWGLLKYQEALVRQISYLPAGKGLPQATKGKQPTKKGSVP